MSARPVAVTGAEGYLGGRLVHHLAGAGSPVRALVRNRVPWLDTEHQHAVDLLGPLDELAEALGGVDAVVHLAGPNEVDAAGDPDGALSDTVLLARHVAAAAAKAGVSRMLYVSTVHVYGGRLLPGAVVDENVSPAPRGPYAVPRLAVEHLVAEAPDPVVFRLSNAVGAPVDVAVDRWTLVANDLCRAALSTGELVLRSTGQQHRDFLPLADVVRIVTACTDPVSVPAGTYNLASGRPTTVRSLAELVQDRVEARLGRRPHLVAPEPEGPDPEPYRIDTARLANLGLRTELPLSQGIDEIIDLCLAAGPETTW